MHVQQRKYTFIHKQIHWFRTRYCAGKNVTVNECYICVVGKYFVIILRYISIWLTMLIYVSYWINNSFNKNTKNNKVKPVMRGQLNIIHDRCPFIVGSLTQGRKDRAAWFMYNVSFRQIYGHIGEIQKPKSKKQSRYSYYKGSYLV